MNETTQTILQIISGLTSIVGGAAILAALLPYPKVSKWLIKARYTLDKLGANFGQAKNLKGFTNRFEIISEISKTINPPPKAENPHTPEE